MFDINIECNKRAEYVYSIENSDNIKNGGLQLLNSFSIKNLITESQKLNHRILFEQISSGQQFMVSIIEAMRDGVTTVTPFGFML